MSLLFRLFLVAVTARCRGRLSFDMVARVRACVLPNDLDLNLHLNNGRYLTIMDLGRVDYLLRFGLLRILLKNRWRPLIGGTVVRYRFGLRAFERFDIATRILGWDDKWFYFEQRFENHRGIAAIALAKAQFRGSAGAVTPESVLRGIGIVMRSPPPTEALSRWLAAEQNLHQEEVPG